MKTTAYLQIKPVYSRFGALTGIVADKLFKKHPRQAGAGYLTIAVQISVPDNLMKAIPVNIVIPDNYVNPAELEVSLVKEEAK